GQLLASLSLGHLELTLVEPLLTNYLVFALVLAVAMSRQAVKGSEVAGPVVGIQDALTRQTLEILQRLPFTHLFTVWPAYCLLSTGIVRLWLMQNAFSSGPL